MVKTKNSTPSTSPTTSTLKTANKLDAYTALGEASNTFFLNLPGYLGMHVFLYFRQAIETRLHQVL